jgi:hypothetical protein
MESCYSLAVIQAAFWEMFHEAGELWFPYFHIHPGDADHNTAVTTAQWDEFQESLAAAHHARLAPSIAAIVALEGVSGCLHAMVDDGNMEDEHLAYTAKILTEEPDDGTGDYTSAHLAEQRACLAALQLLTVPEREEALRQAEADEFEAFYLRHPERRPTPCT